MQTDTNRDKLLAAGSRLILAQGYAGCGLRDITTAAGLPASSFSSHFPSKEAFGLEIMERHYAAHYQLMRSTLRADALPAPLRLQRYFAALLESLDGEAACHGCLFGRLCTEGSSQTELMHSRLADMLLQIQRSLAYCLSAVRRAGMLPSHSEVDELAAFALASLQGAMLLSRTQRNLAPLRSCQHQLLQLLGCSDSEPQEVHAAVDVEYANIP